MSRAWTRSLLAATLSAVLCVLAVWPYGLWFLAPACLAPLVVSLHGAPTFRVVLVGQVHGTVVNAFGFHWVVPAMVEVAGLPLVPSWLLFGVFCTLQGVRSTVLVGLISVGGRRGLFIPLLVALAVLTAELFVPLVFPWYVGTLAASNVVWVQLAELGGPMAISCWLAATNGFIALAWLERVRDPRTARRLLLGGLITAVLATVIGLLLLASAERAQAAAPKSRIGVVQSNTGASEWVGRDPWTEQAESTRRLLARESGVELIVWPETALPLPVLDSALPGLRLLPPAIPTSRPLLLGVSVLDSTEKMFNSAVLLAGDGRVAGRYDKRTLVPLGEKSALPFLDPHDASREGFFTSHARAVPVRLRFSASCAVDLLRGSPSSRVSGGCDVRHRAPRESLERQLVRRFTGATVTSGSCCVSSGRASTVHAARHGDRCVGGHRADRSRRVGASRRPTRRRGRRSRLACWSS